MHFNIQQFSIYTLDIVMITSITYINIIDANSTSYFYDEYNTINQYIMMGNT
ncbi:hypothetical protein FMO003_44610 [Moritella sp. F3]|nr:hypothetical protein FMO001_44360 [Moritella sp. F1]GIC84181.1 hypothetical protein FMO003_44610 [Moritella sp. F3]